MLVEQEFSVCFLFAHILLTPLTLFFAATDANILVESGQVLFVNPVSGISPTYAEIRFTASVIIIFLFFILYLFFFVVILFYLLF